MSKCIHGVRREQGGYLGQCKRCDEDNAAMPLDRCQCCGRLGTWGIRAHPKFSAKLGLHVDGELDLVPLYAHTRAHLDAIVAMMPECALVTIEEFNGKEWVEL